MKEVKIKSVGLSITATIVSGLALAGWATSKEFKGLCAIAFFSSSTAGLVAAAKSAMDERDINEKVRKIVENIQREQSESEGLVQKSAGIVARLSNELQNSQKQLEQVMAELQATQTQLQMANRAFNQKSKELADQANTKDNRFQVLLAELIAKAKTSLYEFIESSYKALDHSCNGLLVRPEYNAIHKELRAFQASLATHKKNHIGFVQEMSGYDITTVQTLLDVPKVVSEVLDTSYQIYEEIGSLRIKFKHIRTMDERRALQQYMESDPHKVTKEFARDILSQQSAYDKEVLRNLEAKINEHGEELARDRREFMEVLKQLESANERVAALSSPMLWEPAIIPATKIGNIIIQFFQQQRIHLDRSHWTGDKHEAVLYFHTTRINPAQRIDIKGLNEHGEYLAQLCQCLKPIVFAHDYEETHMLTAKVVMLHRPEKLKVREKAKEEIKNPLAFLQPSDVLLTFIRNAYHVGLWGATGTGKSTAISNIIGGMVQELGGMPDIRATIPKLDADTAKMFPHVDWLGVRNSVFGLLEAALEIQYRIHLNEQAFLKGEEIKDFDPVLFFIDEINMIFSRWGSINEADAENVLERFETTLSGDRLLYFQNYMKLELMNYKSQFAKRLVLFIWQTGRSLRVKSLIAGQNLKPGAFNMMKMDIANCAYIALGDAIEECKEYKVRLVDEVEFAKNFETLQTETTEKPELKYTGLFCPNTGKSFFSILPPPQTYLWSKDGIAPRESVSITPLTLEASKILEYFKRAKVRAPKNLHDLKKAKSLKGLSEDVLARALAELVDRNVLLVVADKDTQNSTWMFAAAPQ